MQKLKLLLIGFIWISTCFVSSGQDFLEGQQKYAQHLLKSTDGDVVIKEHLRLYYLDKENIYPTTAKVIADLFLQREDYTNAINYLDEYYFILDKDDPERNEIVLAKCKIHLLQNKPKSALVDLLQIRNYKNDDKLVYYRLLVRLLNDQFDKARKEANNLTFLTQEDIAILDKKIARLEKNHDKNPKNAKIYSIFLPGLGQAINGNVVDGLKSFLLLGGIVVLGIELLPALGVFDTALSVGPWYMRYFLGGLDNAEKAAINRKQRTKNKLISEMLGVIESSKISKR